MSGWLWGSSQMDELIDKATSENLPAGTDDLALNLEICDQIRSKQASPKDAAKALKRRLGHKNPNVQLLALGLTDVCVKNGGQHFLVEIASREFIDNMVSILKAPSGVNIEVKNKILALIQTWGQVFRGKQGLGYVCDTYMILQHEGYKFPPADKVGVALVESEAPPDWTDSDVCTRCRSLFTLTNRKHHCRNCGNTFCGQCSSKTMALPNLGVLQEVRVCDGCWMKKKLGTKSVIVQEAHGITSSVPNSHSKAPTSTTSAAASSAGAGVVAVDDDADLLRAIELSLKESGQRAGVNSQQKKVEPAVKKPAPVDEEDDADLLAAIEASLAESQISSGSRNNGYQSQNQGQGQRTSSYSQYSSYSFNKKPTAAVSVASPNELSETEKSNIEMFSVLVDRIQMMQGDVTGNREVQALYEQISKLQMKVALSVEEAAKKQQDFIEFNDKIDQAVKIYDRLLQERLNNAYQRRMTGNSYVNQGQGQGYGNNPGNNNMSTPQTPQIGNVYPRVSSPESRYSEYVPISGPGGTYGSAPPQQQQQHQQQQQQQQQGQHLPYVPQIQHQQQQQQQQQGPPPLQQFQPQPQQQQFQPNQPYAPAFATAPGYPGQDVAAASVPPQQQQQQPQQQAQVPQMAPPAQYTYQTPVAPVQQQPGQYQQPGTVQSPPQQHVVSPVQHQLSGGVAQAPYVPYDPSFSQAQAPPQQQQQQQQQPYQQQPYQQQAMAPPPVQPAVAVADLIEF